jgi:hypothetical protein
LQRCAGVAARGVAADKDKNVGFRNRTRLARRSRRHLISHHSLFQLMPRDSWASRRASFYEPRMASRCTQQAFTRVDLQHRSQQMGIGLPFPPTRCLFGNSIMPIRPVGVATERQDKVARLAMLSPYICIFLTRSPGIGTSCSQRGDVAWSSLRLPLVNVPSWEKTWCPQAMTG